MKRLRFASAILVCLLVTLPLRAQTSRPTENTATVADQVAENQPLRAADGAAPADQTAGSKTTTSSGISELSRIAIALLVVIGLILILRSAFRNFSALPGAQRAGKLVTVLSRSVVSPKQQVLVLQFGKRLIVVGDSGGHMTPLCEVSDPDEVAAIVGQSRSEQENRADRPIGSFGNLFRRANEPFAESATAAELSDNSVKNVDAVDMVSAEEVGGLLDKIRTLQQQFRQT